MFDREQVTINLIFTGEKNPLEYHPTPVMFLCQLACYTASLVPQSPLLVNRNCFC